MDEMPASSDAGSGGADDGQGVPAVAAGESRSGEAGSTPRRRRRPRRRSSAASAERSETPSGEGPQGGEAISSDASPSGDDAGTPAVAPSYAQPEDLGDLFSRVLSGDYDRELEPVAEAQPELESGRSSVAAKRVLLPDPEAPKLHKVLAALGRVAIWSR